VSGNTFSNGESLSDVRAKLNATIGTVDNLPAAALSGAYADLSGLPDLSRAGLGLGTAADAAIEDFATAAQGAKADTALQPGDIPDPVQLTQTQAENPASTVFGTVSGQRLAQAVAANPPSTAAVLSATAGASAGDVGTYAFLGVANGSHTSLFGETRAGSELFPAGISANNNFSTNGFLNTQLHAGQNSARAGTWRCVGVLRSQAGNEGLGIPARLGATLWLRIS
jgi:hypothetical protein